MGRLERKLDDDAILRARLKLGRDEPTMTRRLRAPRKAESYRGARRNAARDAGTLNQWRNTRARYVPYEIKPPVVKFTLFGRIVITRKQPKIYRGPVLSPAERRARDERRTLDPMYSLRKLFGLVA